MSSFLWVGLGGAVGAVCRYGLSLVPVRCGFPILTLLTNLLGAVAIGFVAGLAAGRSGLSQNQILFWKTGVCGGFTTFSTFSLEALTLLEREKYLAAAAYLLLSVTLCLAGVCAGRYLARQLHRA